MFAKIASTVACVPAGAALAVSLTHHGPAGPRGPQGQQGPQGNAGKAATTARFGVCWSDAYQNSSTVSWADAVSIDQPVLSDGVYTCPQGDSFVSVVPQAGKAQ